MGWKQWLVRFAPLTSLGLCFQTLFVLIWPKDPISIEFLRYADDLFVAELVFMHSSIFWNMKNYIAKGFWTKLLLSVFLIFAYGLFIFPMAQKNWLLGASYLLYCASHIFEFDQKHWLEKTLSLQKFIEPKDHKFLIGTFSLLKACYLALFLTLISYFVPANPDLSSEFVTQITGITHDAGNVITEVKTMFLYFLGLTVFEIYQFVKKSTSYPK